VLEGAIDPKKLRPSLVVQTLKRISVGVTIQVDDQNGVKFDALNDLLTFNALEIHKN
jgi:hypothetical protein